MLQLNDLKAKCYICTHSRLCCDARPVYAVHINKGFSLLQFFHLAKQCSLFSRT